jgi:nitrite reductase (NADH) small subunit
VEYVIGHRSDLPPGSRRAVQVNGREIHVFNVDGRFFAVLNQCPHQGGPVCQGGLFEDLKCDVLPFGRYREYIEADGYILACPWHGWEYDIRTGTCLWNRKYRVRTYRVEERADGDIVLHV